MRRIFSFLTVITLIFSAQAAASSSAEERDVAFQLYSGGYFEKNNSGLTGAKSFLAFTDQQQFDRVFGFGAVMRSNNVPLPRGTFDNKIVLATITRGSTIPQYSDVEVTVENGVLLVSYTAVDRKMGSGRFSVPFILAVDKGKYDGVIFMENGERVGVTCLRQDQ